MFYLSLRYLGILDLRDDFDVDRCILGRQWCVVHLTSLQLQRWGGWSDIALAFHSLHHR